MSDTSLTHAIEEAGRLMRHTLMQDGVTLQIDCAKDIPFIQGNSIQIEQVFVNLISNARDAITQAGRRDGLIRVSVREHMGSVVVSITDNGCGMSDSVMQKIFDPFYTTKPVGKGTGLGLSISWGILKNMGAEIEVESEPGTGTEFKIHFKTKAQQNKGDAA
jgi:two-component system NtrC family sensor kinase